MARDNLIHLPINVLYLKLEIILIFINTFLSLFAILLLYSGNRTFEKNINNVYLFINNNRMVPNSYLTDISLGDKDKSWAKYGTYLCEKNFEYHTFFDVKYMSNASLTDVTNTIKVIDLDNYIKNNNDRQISNPNFKDAKFYELDMMKQGNNSIEFMNTISLYTFKQYVFCKKRLFFEEDKSNLQLIHRNLSCDSLVEDKTENKYINCGELNEHYRICVDKSGATFNYRQLNNDIDHIVDLDYCPIMDIEIKFFDNEKFKNDSLTNPYLAMVTYTKNNTVYNLKTNESTLMTYLDHNITNEYDGIGFNQFLVSSRNFPRNLLVNLEDAITFTKYYDLENDTGKYNQTATDFIYSDPDAMRNLNIGDKYGIRDSYTRIFDQQGFYSFYNSSNYLGNITYKENNKTYTSYLPFAMNSPDSKKHYSPKIQNEEEEKINSVYIGFYEMKPFSVNCFENVFVANKRPDVLNFLDQIRIDFLHEVYPTLMAWFFIVLFIQFWGFIKIRVSYLFDILNFRVNEADIKTEKITKYTFKFFLFLAFLIIYKGLSLENERMDIILNNAEKLIKYKCLLDSVSNNLKAIEKFMEIIDESFSKVRYIFYFLIFSETLTIINYIVNNKNDFKPVEKDKYLEAKMVKIE
jgi:hypothetical protein